jgi:hypothetical protein
MVIFLLETGRNVVTDAEWQAKAKGLLKGELKRRGIGYRELAAKLAALGVPETEQNIANKISRGGFSAVFLLQCLEAIGCKTLATSLD